MIVWKIDSREYIEKNDSRKYIGWMYYFKKDKRFKPNQTGLAHMDDWTFCSQLLWLGFQNEILLLLGCV
jgi:hypothetical protein